MTRPDVSVSGRRQEKEGALDGRSPTRRDGQRLKHTQTLKLLKYFPLHVVKSVGFNLGQFGACDVSLLLLKLNKLADARHGLLTQRE